MTPQERIEAHIIGEMRDDLCWETDYAISGGYPQIAVNGSCRRVHRIAWEIYNAQPIPPGMIVLHRCDNPKCCNPAHLMLGTHSLNAEDRVAKNRHTPQAKGYLKTRHGKYQAQIWKNGKNITLGNYTTPEEAHAVYLKAREELTDSFTPPTHETSNHP